MEDFWWKILCRFSSGKLGLKLVTENSTTFFTVGKEICHLELTLGASSPTNFEHVSKGIFEDFKNTVATQKRRKLIPRQ